MVNNVWCEMNGTRDVSILAAWSSDHKPLMISIVQAGEVRNQYHKSFKFEAKWLIDEECQKIVEEAWTNGEPGISAMHATRQKLE